MMERWKPAGAWRLPVGDAVELGRPSPAGEPGFQLNRGVERSGGRVTHQGADLANGRGGDTVHAVAHGLVVLAQRKSTGNGYGVYVVLAHRLPDDRLAYSVYAHLSRGSVRPRAGDVVNAGDPVGRVGRTGRASTSHLHFEVRAPERPDERWERAPVVNPIAFVTSRLTEPPIAPGAGLAYFEWARNASLLPPGASAQDPLTRGAWWRMLATASKAKGISADAPAAELRDRLIEVHLLPEEEFGAPPEERLSWSELARDIKRLRQAGVRSPRGPLVAGDHATECESRFGERRPSTHTKTLRRLSGDPTTIDACVLLADVSGPRSE
jgi:hypothetical protein